MAKSSQEILTDLVAEFVGHPRHPRLLSNREGAERARESFLADYPLRDRPALVRNYITTSAGAEDFVRRLARDHLLWLGAIDLKGNRPITTAGQKIGEFRSLLERVVDPVTPVWKKIDGSDWGNVYGFGGEFRQIAKKMVNIYYPELTLPIFNTEHLEHFAEFLRVDKNSISTELYGSRYPSLVAPGEIWHVLSEALTRERDQNAMLRNEDNVYFMYCLYRSRACPPKFHPREPYQAAGPGSFARIIEAR
jgi:hypothetical protein